MATRPSFGTAGAGSPPHVGGVLLQSMTGVKGPFISYRGNSLAVQDLVAGQIDIVVSDPTTATPQVRAGTIKAYAVAAPTRLPALPDVPTAAEAGLPRIPSVDLERAVCAEGHTEGDHRKAQRCSGGGTGRSFSALATCCRRPGGPAARAADTRGARRAAQGRHREMVADHQGGEYQVGIAAFRGAAALV